MTLSHFIIFVFVLLLGGVAWWIHISRLANRLFGPDHRVRYLFDRWVIASSVAGRTIKYTTGGFGFLPALTYLFLESEVGTEFSVTKDQQADKFPEQIKKDIAFLRSRNGFKRLDVVKAGSSWFNTGDRVSLFSHPGEGIMLRRYTKFGGDADFVQRDIRSLLSIADLLSGSASGGSIHRGTVSPHR